MAAATTSDKTDEAPEPIDRIVLYIDDLDRCSPGAGRRGAAGGAPAPRPRAVRRGRRRRPPVARPIAAAQYPRTCSTRMATTGRRATDGTPHPRTTWRRSSAFRSSFRGWVTATWRRSSRACRARRTTGRLTPGGPAIPAQAAAADPGDPAGSTPTQTATRIARAIGVGKHLGRGGFIGLHRSPEPLRCRSALSPIPRSS